MPTKVKLRKGMFVTSYQMSLPKGRSTKNQGLFPVVLYPVGTPPMHWHFPIVTLVFHWYIVDMSVACLCRPCHIGLPISDLLSCLKSLFNLKIWFWIMCRLWPVGMSVSVWGVSMWSSWKCIKFDFTKSTQWRLVRVSMWSMCLESEKVIASLNLNRSNQ